VADGLGEEAGLRSSVADVLPVEVGEPEAAVVEFCGRRTVLAGFVVPAGEPFRVWTLTARAADPVRRTPAAVRTRTVFVFMSPP
jgi:hypothetical protein